MTDVAKLIARVVQHPNRGLLDAPRLGLLCILPSFTSLRFRLNHLPQTQNW